MIQKLATALIKPRLEYSLLEHRPPAPKMISAPDSITLLHSRPNQAPESTDDLLLNIGDTIQTGQKLVLTDDDDTYALSSATGTIRSVSPFTGNFGNRYSAITVDVADTDTWDTAFSKAAADPSLDLILANLRGVPGDPALTVLNDPDRPIDTLVVYGLDGDLFSTTNQYALYADHEDIRSGIRILKQTAGVDNVVILVPRHFVHGLGEMGAKLAAVDAEYPSAHPVLVCRNVLGRTVPAGKDVEDVGVAFFTAEAVASIGRAFDTGKIPVTKTFTLASKEGVRTLVSARIGTPVSRVLADAGLTLGEGDRIIFGGPMNGSAIYSLDQPIGADTDIVYLQDHTDIPAIDDSPCINCGECVRVCPMRISVNMLIRFLDAGQYEDAADQYDLHCCIECGFCSYVCVSRIPIYQYIRLAKHELARTQSLEETDV